MKNSSEFIFKPVVARRIPDPVFKEKHGTEKHIFLININQMPLGISNEANARNPNIKKQTYRLVEESLLDRQAGSELGSFHLKNKGIVIIAESVEQKSDGYAVKILPQQGIVDGGHTYKLITTHIEEGDLPENQFVTVEIRTGILDGWIPDIAGGLNTGVQVQEMSLEELKGNFSEIKDALKPSGIERKIAWSENEPGSYNARDIIALMSMFNIALYPNDEANYPTEAYSSKAKILKKFKDDHSSFDRMKHIVEDILVLHDTINSTAPLIWNQYKRSEGAKGRAGGLGWMEQSKSNAGFNFPFINDGATQKKTRLTNGALYPILGAFRAYVEYDPLNKLEIRWKVPFSQVLKAWENNAVEMLQATAELCDDLGRNPGALGKSKSNWGNMYNIVSKNLNKSLSKN